MASKIVIADDDLEMRRLLGAVLEAHGYDVELVADGRELLEAITACDPSELPDLIVTDLRMPGLSGLDVLRRLPAGRRPTIVLITAFGDAQVHRRARELGAAVVVDKPFDIGELRDTIDGLVG